jgi:hypothetical protein
MNIFVIANNVQTTLSAATSSTSTTFTLSSSANLPTLLAGQMMPITFTDDATGLIREICYITAISGTTLTVIRAREGTGAQNWSVGDGAACLPTAGTVALLQNVQAGTYNYATDTGVANAYAGSLSPSITAYTPGLEAWISGVINSNTGASTLALNGLAALPIYGAGGKALQGGEIAAGFAFKARVNSAATAFDLIDTTSGYIAGTTVTATQKFLSAEGSGAVGGYSFLGDGAADTGMFSASDGQLSLYTNAQAVINMTGGVAGFPNAPKIPNASASNNPVALGQFIQSISGNGYFQLPSGLIFQWGSPNVTLGTDGTWNFPIAFPNSCFLSTMYLVPNTTANVGYIIRGGTNTTTGTNYYWDGFSSKGVGNVIGAASFAIGY